MLHHNMDFGGEPKSDFVVDREGRLSEADRLALVPPGRALNRGFAPSGAEWDLSGLVCCGPVAGPADAAAALLAAARGAGLVVGPVEPAVWPGFRDELTRLAAASRRRVVEPDSAPSVPDPVVAALLDALAQGLTVAEAARRCAVSLRTAHRRLAEARVAQHLPTTGALVAGATRARAGGPAA